MKISGSLMIFANAVQSSKYPDTCYVDVIDLETAQACQFSTRKVGAEFFNSLNKTPMIVDGEIQIRPRMGGNGYQVVLMDIHLRRPGEASGDGDGKSHKS